MYKPENNKDDIKLKNIEGERPGKINIIGMEADIKNAHRGARTHDH